MIRHNITRIEGSIIMTSLNDIVKQNESLINKVNANILSSVFDSVKSIYIDLPLLRDTRMGLMLNLAKTEEDINYLKEGLAKYNIRPNRHFTTVYPEFKYDEDTLNKFYHNPNNSDKIFDRSPDTDFSGGLEVFFNNIHNKNTRAGITQSISVTINTYPLEITPSIVLYHKVLHDAYGDIVDFKFINTDIKTISRSTWKKFDILFIDELSQVFDKKTDLYHLVFDEMGFTDKSIYAPYCCDDVVLDKWKQYHIDTTNPTTVNDIFKVSEYLIASYCYFSFIPFQIPLPKE